MTSDHMTHITQTLCQRSKPFTIIICEPMHFLLEYKSINLYENELEMTISPTLGCLLNGWNLASQCSYWSQLFLKLAYWEYMSIIVNKSFKSFCFPYSQSAKSRVREDVFPQCTTWHSLHPNNWALDDTSVWSKMCWSGNGLHQVSVWLVIFYSHWFFWNSSCMAVWCLFRHYL